MSQKKPYNAGDETEVRKAAGESEKFADAEYESLKFIMSDERGMRFIWWLLSECHIYQTSFTGNSQTFFLEGERNVGLKVMDRLHRQHLKDYLRMVQIHAEEDDS
ncbi:MAG: hypothetical protein AB2797_00495 [Candidatus Thiodiazotropha sp.]